MKLFLPFRLTFLICCGLFVSRGMGGPVAWPQFRGPNSSGISNVAAPVEFGPEKNVRWRLSLESGHSSPCVAGDRLFLTTYRESEQRLAVVCVARSRGEILWERAIFPKTIEKGHPSFNPASSSPCTDGERVVAYFGSYGLVCYDEFGNPLWERRMPVAQSYAGNATSPVIYGDKVFLYRANRIDHFILALDKETGEDVWREEQAEPFVDELSCAAVPIRYGDQLLIHSARAMQSVDLETGALRWVTKLATTATSVPVIAGNEVFVAAWNKMGEPALRPEFPSFDALINQHDSDGDGLIGRGELPTLWIFHRPEGAEAPENGATIRMESVDSDRDERIDPKEWETKVRELETFRSQYKTHGMVGIRLDGAGALEAESVRTLFTRGIPEVPSPVVQGDYLYFVKNGGLLTCLDRASGRRVYQERTGGTGTHYASPIIAGDVIYTFAGNGVITCARTGAEFEILAVNEMEDSVYATPAFVDGEIYIRTHSALWAFGRD